MPTDTGPIRVPLADSVPAVGQIQQQVPAIGDQIPRIIEHVSALGRPSEAPAPGSETSPPEPLRAEPQDGDAAPRP